MYEFADRGIEYFRNTAVNVKVKFTLEQATKARKESRDVALFFL